MTLNELRVPIIKIILFILVVFVVDQFIFVFTPFFLGMVLAIVVERPVTFFSKWVPRGVASLFMLIVVLAVLLLLISLMVANIVQEFEFLLQDLPQYRDLMTEFVEDLMQRQDEFFEVIPSVMVDVIEANLNNFYHRGEQFLSQIMNEILNITLNIPNIIIFILFTIISGFFISKDKEIIKKFFISILKTNNETQSDMVEDMLSYMKVQISIMSITMILTGILFVVLRSPYAILLAMGCGLLDIIPVVGPGGVLWPMMVYYAYFSPVTIIPVFLTYLAVITVRPIFESRILGGNIGVHPLVLLLGIYAGLITLGFKGVIIAPLSIIIYKTLSKAGVISTLKDIRK